MATVNKNNRKQFDRLLNADTKTARFPGETIVMFDPITKEGGILTASGDDFYYPSPRAIKLACKSPMECGSFWCGNDNEIRQLAEFAGFENWINEMRIKLGVEDNG